jgi:hypothetical protein
VLVQDKAGGAWVNGVVVSGGSCTLTPRSGQTAIARLRMFIAGTLSAATQTAMAVAA